jgi:hypothetical protein
MFSIASTSLRKVEGGKDRKDLHHCSFLETTNLAFTVKLVFRTLCTSLRYINVAFFIIVSKPFTGGTLARDVVALPIL